LSHSKFATEVSDDELRNACVRIYNDAMAEVQQESGGRLLPMALLPVWDERAMAIESERCVEELGLRGFVVSDKPEYLGLPGFRSDYWDPIFGICSETETPLNFHVGGDPSASPMFSFAWDDYGLETKTAIWTCMFAMANARTIANFCYSGIFDKYPGLKLVSVESGLGWIPYLLEAMEFQLDEMMPNEGKALQRRPREYFNDHFFTSFWFEEHGPRLPVLEAVGVNNVMLETDYPHPTCLYPHHEHVAAIVNEWTPEVARRVLQDNAAELYKVELPAPAVGAV
jgi:predicted TIM-barrel fold metal-dependent hydrolase